MSTDPPSDPPSRADVQEAQPSTKTTSTAETVDTVETAIDPEIATTHLARFEFSADGGGTKVLMVEWQPGVKSTTTITEAGSEVAIEEHQDEPAKNEETAEKGLSVDGWEVSWPGKSTNLPARDTDQEGERRRVFFLLPPDAQVPTTITIKPTSVDATENSNIIVKPLPAIFPDGFDVEVGKRGVLHGLWAQKRVAELDRELDARVKANGETAGVDMTLAEKQWIVENFLTPPQKKDVAPMAPMNTASVAPLSPRSPTAQLGNKMKGLKLATSPADLVPMSTGNNFAGVRNFRGGDDAVGSMSAITQTNRARGGASLDAALKGDSIKEDSDEEEDLFALPMSPRSPDMAKSPFSFLHKVANG